MEWSFIHELFVIQELVEASALIYYGIGQYLENLNYVIRMACTSPDKKGERTSLSQNSTFHFIFNFKIS